jgi:hypothetical protein
MKKLSIKKIALLIAVNFFICIASIAQTSYESHAMDISLKGTV